MRNLDTYIIEKILINKDTNIYSCHPTNKDELKQILRKRLNNDKNANLNDIDVSKIIDMGIHPYDGGLFEDLDPHNINVSNWNMSNVTNTSGLFYNCTHFNCDISNWDMHNVKDMHSMFFGCKQFNCNLNKWNVSNVKHKGFMFTNSGLEENPPKWYYTI